MNKTFLDKSDLSEVIEYCIHDVEIVRQFCERTNIVRNKI